MTERIAEVVRAHHTLAAAGQTDMVWGHVAVRDPGGRGVWMKASGWGFEEVGADRVLLVSWDGAVLEGTGSRHLEYPIHTGIMAVRSDVDCVVHTHSVSACAFASLEAPLRAISHDGVLFTEPDVPRFTQTGGLIKTPQLGTELARTLGGARACLLPQHGLVAVGTDVAHAVMHAVLLDRACRTQLTAMTAGGPRRWSDTGEVIAKRAECWPPSQIEAGWQYLMRQSDLTKEKNGD